MREDITRENQPIESQCSYKSDKTDFNENSIRDKEGHCIIKYFFHQDVTI